MIINKITDILANGIIFIDKNARVSVSCTASTYTIEEFFQLIAEIDGNAKTISDDLFSSVKKSLLLNENMCIPLSMDKRVYVMNIYHFESNTIVMFKDITDAKTLYLEAEQEEAVLAVSELSHHWKQPLNSFYIFLQLLNSAGDDCLNNYEINAFAGECIKEIDRLSLMIDTMAGFYSWQGEQGTINVASELLRAVNRLLLDGAKIKLKIECSLICKSDGENFQNISENVGFRCGAGLYHCLKGISGGHIKAGGNPSLFNKIIIHALKPSSKNEEISLNLRSDKDMLIIDIKRESQATGQHEMICLCKEIGADLEINENMIILKFKEWKFFIPE